MDNELVIALRLIDVSLELSILKEQLRLIEEQIEQGSQKAESELVTHRLALPPDDEDEWFLLAQLRDFQIEVVLPRILRGPFLVTLFSVYESSVTEVAGLIQEKQGMRISLDDLKGDLLKRAKKYYKDVLNFKLYASNVNWTRLKKLSLLRNAIAHSNGRMNMISARTGETILGIEGVNGESGYVIVDGALLRKAFALVNDELEDLMARYREWDTAD